MPNYYLPTYKIIKFYISFILILFQLGQTIKDENGSGSVVVITSGQESQMSYQEKVAFEVFLPLNQKQVHT